MQLWKHSPEAARGRLNWALNPLHLHKAGCDKVAKAPHKLSIYKCFHVYGLHNKNAISVCVCGGGTVRGMEIGGDHN